MRINPYSKAKINASSNADILKWRRKANHYSDLGRVSAMWSNSGTYERAIQVSYNNRLQLLPNESKSNLFGAIEGRVSFPTELGLIADAIEDSKELLSLQSNWDEENANATNKYALSNAHKFLLKYAVYVFNEYGIVISTPYIDIMRDGAIYISWDLVQASFLVIFKKEESLNSYFYGERRDKKIPFKSAIENDGDIDEILALWMSKYLK